MPQCSGMQHEHSPHTHTGSILHCSTRSVGHTHSFRAQVHFGIYSNIALCPPRTIQVLARQRLAANWFVCGVSPHVHMAYGPVPGNARILCWHLFILYLCSCLSINLCICLRIAMFNIDCRSLTDAQTDAQIVIINVSPYEVPSPKSLCFSTCVSHPMW